jgi:methionyl-tRNA formyltransferase
MKIIVASQSCLSLPLIQQLEAKGELASVWLHNVRAEDSQQLGWFCQQQNIPLLVIDPAQPQALLEHFDAMTADCAISAFLSYLFPPQIIEKLQGRLVNIHASALPQLRGADPLFWLLRQGANETQLSVHQVTDKVDEGDLLFQQALLIHPFDTHQSLSNAVATELPVLIDGWIDAGGLEVSKWAQQGEPSSAPKVQVSERKIDWLSMSSLDIFNFVRACTGAGQGAWFRFGQEYLQLLECTPVQGDNLQLEPGIIVHIGAPEGMLLASTDGLLRLDVISSHGGIFSGLRFAERYLLQAGQQFESCQVIK